MISDPPMRILVLGASGQFGKRLCRRLVRLDGLHLLLAGRDRQKLEAARRQLAAPDAKADTIVCDINDPRFADALYVRKVALVIHLAGPFQEQDYQVARACLRAGVAYIDMADGREFAANFASLDREAKEKKIPLITGASTVPGLSSAVLDEASKDFSEINAAEYGICAALKTGLGLATLQAVLSYCGKPYEVLKNGDRATVHGLGSPRYHDFPAPLGRRYVVDCDIPDHALFPARYPALKQMSFGSCLDVPGLARILALMSFAVRKGWITDWNFLSGFIKPFMDIARSLGSPHSGFFMYLDGRDKRNAPRKMMLDILARDGSGLEIPVTPVVLLVKRMLQGEQFPAGAYPCMGLFSLAEFQQELSPFPISWNWQTIP
jgi:Saccharopine dehydrogenase NADP binding domain